MTINQTIREFGFTVRSGIRSRLHSLLAPRNALPLTVFILVLGCGLYLIEQNHAISDNDQHMVVQQILETQESELLRRLSYLLSST